MDQFDAVYNVC